jgi:phage shock protein PspC (stress-responsive transcriptional regulator)/heme/copper-type cytochrome/quinol oxidase subunit 2
MKKVININFQGRVTPIEESAFEVLNKYIESLRKYFANEEGRDEIINDIEGRIAELFAETLKKGSTCITEDDVNRIIDSIGRPEDFDADDNTQKNTSNAEQQQQYQYTANAEPKRLYRDENSKILGGVCGGLANYFNIDPVVIRVLFVVFFGVTFLPYIILWVAVPSSASKIIGSQRKRLFRDPDDKFIAGVCSGLSNYFGVSVWIPRLLFLIPFISFVFRMKESFIGSFPSFIKFSFSPTALFVYVILWILIPEAKTSAEKLEMKGEKVDLNNIKNTIQNDMMSFAKKAEKFGEEIGEKGKAFGESMANKGAQMGTEAAGIVRKKSKGLGDIIALIAKVFAYFVLGCVLVSVLAVLFGVGVASAGLLPLKSYLINDGWQTIYAWGTIILFIWVPVIGIIVFVLRRLLKMKGNSNIIRYTFTALWVLGWFCVISLIAGVSKEFKYKNKAVEENIILENAKVSKIEVRASSFGNYYNNDWLQLKPFASITEDTAFIRNVRIRIVKATGDSFSVKMARFSLGKSKVQAEELANKIHYKIEQKDTILLLAKGIAITPAEKFRNQHIVVTIAVPVGKKIIIHKNSGWHWDHYEKIDLGNDDEWSYDWDDNNNEQRWKHEVEYIMTQNGLQRTAKQTDNNFDEDEDYNSKLKNYQKSKEELKMELEEAERKAKELKEQLNNSATDSLKPQQKNNPAIKQKVNATTTQKIIHPFNRDYHLLMHLSI